MAFLEIRPLDKIAIKSSGGPEFSTDIVQVRSGLESRNGNWDQALHSYEIGLVARPRSQFEIMKAAFLAVRGRLDGFRWKDVGDYQVTTAEGKVQSVNGILSLGTAGFGYGVPTGQLAKLYTAGANTYLRFIRKPVASTLILLRNGSPVTSGVSAGNYAIDLTTGIFTMVEDQSKAISSHTVGANHVFTLASAFSPNLIIGGQIYVSGITGTAASVLNGKSHTITNVSAAVITTSTNTAGLTASGGTAFYYPQPTETLAFSVEFDVPVRFGVDKFDAAILDREGPDGELLLSLPSIPLIEDRSE